MASWAIVYFDERRHRQLRDTDCVSRETAVRQARAYLQQGGDVLRILGPNGEVILRDEILQVSNPKSRAATPVFGTRC